MINAVLSCEASSIPIWKKPAPCLLYWKTLVVVQQWHPALSQFWVSSNFLVLLLDSGARFWYVNIQISRDLIPVAYENEKKLVNFPRLTPSSTCIGRIRALWPTRWILTILICKWATHKSSFVFRMIKRGPGLCSQQLTAILLALWVPKALVNSIPRSLLVL